MAEYIDLNNTEVLAEAGENAKLVVEEDGELKRIPASAVGQVKTVNGVEPDEAGNVTFDALPAGATAHQQLVTDGEGKAKWEDKAFYETGFSVKWDGNTDGMVSTGLGFYKVSDTVLTREQCVDAFVPVISNGTFMPVWVLEEMLSVNNENIFGCDLFVVVKEDGAQLSEETFPEKGLYFMGMGSEEYTAEFTTADYAFKPIDSKFIEPRVLYVGGGILYHDANCTQGVTIAEFTKMPFGRVYIAFNNEGSGFEWYLVTGFRSNVGRAYYHGFDNNYNFAACIDAVS